MIHLKSPFRNKSLITSFYFASSRLLAINNKINLLLPSISPPSKLIPVNDVPSLLNEYEQAFQESRSDLSGVNLPLTLNKLVLSLSSTKSQTAIYNQVIRFTNQIQSSSTNSQHHRKDYQNLWQAMDQSFSKKLPSFDSDTLINSIYYFSKYKKGTDEFWKKSKEILLNTQISHGEGCRVLLALTMADKLTKQLIDKYIQFLQDNDQTIIQNLNDDQIFYLSVTFAQPSFMGVLTSALNDSAKVNQKIFEYKDRIIGAVTRNLQNYDLYQLSQIMAVFSQMPNEPFTKAFEARIFFFIQKFKEYEQKNINKSGFLLDMSKNFLSASFSFQPISEKFVTTCTQFFKAQCPSFPQEAIEMVIVAALRAESRDQQFSSAIVQEVQKRELIQGIKINQISVLAFMAFNEVKNQAVLQAIQENVMVQFVKQQEKEIDPSILSLIAFSFSKLKGQAKDKFTDDFYDVLVQKILKIQSNAEDISFQNVSDFMLFQQQAELKNEDLVKKIVEFLSVINLNDQTVHFGITQFSTLMTFLIQHKMFQSLLWKSSCESVEKRIMNYEIGQFFELFTMCSQLGLGRPEFWTKVRQRINHQVDNYRVEQILGIHNCLAIEGINVQKFWDKVKSTILTFDENKFEFNDFLSLAWSLSKIEKQTGKAVTDSSFWQQFTTQLKNRKSLDLNQISQTLLALKQNKHMGNDFEDLIQNSILQRCKVESEVNNTVIQSTILEIQNSNFTKKQQLLGALSAKLK